MSCTHGYDTWAWRSPALARATQPRTAMAHRPCPLGGFLPVVGSPRSIAVDELLQFELPELLLPPGHCTRTIRGSTEWHLHIDKGRGLLRSRTQGQGKGTDAHVSSYHTCVHNVHIHGCSIAQSSTAVQPE